MPTRTANPLVNAGAISTVSLNPATGQRVIKQEEISAGVLPTLAARNGIIGPSGALACRLLDAFDEYLEEYPVRPITTENRSYFAFSGDPPPEETFKSLGLDQIVIAKHL